MVCRFILASVVAVVFGGQCLPMMMVFAFAGAGDGKYPSQVLIFRHAEKPDDQNDPHLTSRGAGRAAALSSLFQSPPTFRTKNAPFPNPDYIFATKKSSRSDRPVETVRPLAKALNLMLDHHYADKEHRSLAAELLGDAKYAGKTILICWHHGKIPALAGELLERSPNKHKAVKTIPANFDEARFDRVFATIRLRHRRTKGNGTRKTSLAMMFKLAQAAQKKWHRLHGSERLTLLLQGKVFVDGVLQGAA